MAAHSGANVARNRQEQTVSAELQCKKGQYFACVQRTDAGIMHG